MKTKNITNFIKKNLSTFVYVGGIVGTLAAVSSAVYSTIKAVDRVDEAEAKKVDDLTVVEKTKIIAPYYVMPLALTFCAGSCLKWLYKGNKKLRLGMTDLVGCYGVLDQTFKAYQRKADDIFGEGTAAKIIDGLAVEESQESDVCGIGIGGGYSLGECSEEEQVILVYDSFGKRFFKSTLTKLIAAEYHLNRNYILRGDAVVNELYEFLGISTIPVIGDEYGWSVVDMDGVWIDFNNRKVDTEDGYSYYVIETIFEPSRYYETD